MPTHEPVAGSFRDPSGFVYHKDGILLRQINPAYRQDYEACLASGLFDALHDAGLLIPHQEAPPELAATPGAFKVVRPYPIPFISYPYEWCFSQLKDAALCTLDIQMRALDRGLSLKDASAFNIQFVAGRPILIDTLSFERYEPGKPWVAYGQFCRHFLAPLALMAYRDARLGQLARTHLDGVPLDFASRLLPFRARLRPGIGLHIQLHARTINRKSNSSATQSDTRQMTLRGLRGLVDNLRATVTGLQLATQQTEWGSYYEEVDHADAYYARKAELVERACTQIAKVAWDLGANTGRFSRIAAKTAELVLALDGDPLAVERNYLQSKQEGETRLLPLLMDLANPSPAQGWAHEERSALVDRANADLVLALALIHHLAIGNNLPLQSIAAFMARIAPRLIIEFVPKTDPQVQRMLAFRRDIFDDYTQAAFELAFAAHFETEWSEQVSDSPRRMYVLRRRND